MSNSNLDIEKVQMTEDDIIAKLMEETPAPEATYALERLGIQVTLRGLSEKEVNRVRKECTFEKKVRGGQKIKELDNEEFNAALIEKSTVTPNWNNSKLLDALKASDGRQVIKKKLLAGETAALGDKVLSLSGFDSELEEIENIKN
ncbi:MAG: phage tail assembly chaperone [Paraclostridium sp.]